MKKRIIIATLALLVSLNTAVFATPVTGDDASVNLDSVLTEIATLEAGVQEINCDVYDLEELIKDTENKIKQVKSQIEKNQEEIELKAKDVKAQGESILQKAKTAYINNVNSSQQYIEVLLNSRSIKDFAQRFFVIRDVIKSNKDKLDKYNEDKLNLENKQKLVKEKEAALNKMIESLNKEHDVLIEKKKTQERKIDEYKILKEQYEAEILENESRIATVVAEISEEYNEENIYDEVETDSVSESNGVSSESSTSGTATGSALVNIALKYLGVPYVWGGTTPSGFDCSGFVQYVYREAGINISRTTYTQIAEGYPVSDLQPGDLVFFGSYSDPYHVGMYIGNGQYVHSPTTGDVVKVASLQYRSDYCGARRYI